LNYWGDHSNREVKYLAQDTLDVVLLQVEHLTCVEIEFYLGI